MLLLLDSRKSNLAKDLIQRYDAGGQTKNHVSLKAAHVTTFLIVQIVNLKHLKDFIKLKRICLPVCMSACLFLSLTHTLV